MRSAFLILALSTAALSGCASVLDNKNVAKDFDCPVQEGFGCKSISSIRSLIVQGGEPQQAFYNTEAPDVSLSGVPKWSPDVVLKIHVGNYIDSHGDYHDDSTMYVVARHGGWETKE